MSASAAVMTGDREFKLALLARVQVLCNCRLASKFHKGIAVLVRGCLSIAVSYDLMRVELSYELRVELDWSGVAIITCVVDSHGLDEIFIFIRWRWRVHSIILAPVVQSL